jgi:hypothetical protein
MGKRGNVVEALEQERAALGRRLGQREEEGQIALARGELFPVIAMFHRGDHPRDPVVPEGLLDRVE